MGGLFRPQEAVYLISMAQERKLPKRLAYSVREVAHAASVSPATIYRLIYRNEVRTVRIGDRQLIPNYELHRITGTAGT